MDADNDRMNEFLSSIYTFVANKWLAMQGSPDRVKVTLTSPAASEPQEKPGQ